MKFYSNVIVVSLLLVISQSVCDAAEDNYYEILGVSKSASPYEIKKAYRKKALKEHPDTNRGDPGATERFQKVNRAYEVLSDDDKRKAYDRCGVKCVEQEGSMDHTDPFASFFGDFGFSFGNEERGSRDTPKGGTINMDLYVTLEELYSGNFIEVCKHYLIHLKVTKTTLLSFVNGVDKRTKRNYFDKILIYVFFLVLIQITRNKPVMKPASGTRKCNCRQEMVTRNLGPGRFQMIQQNVRD